ncbi:hypothetical protein [Paenibacillus tyrfis]|uniref:hypothetical protein n=1 Tax=Paenibacillus tyrfis TaxID=1501230 RepID=UPI000B591E7A|nr:hypothetical protein [Paenibacillus tyrfis]
MFKLKKRVVMASILSMALLGGSGYYYMHERMIDTVEIHALYARGFTNIQEMKDYADIVIVGTPTQNFMDSNHVLKTSSSGDILDFFTKRDFKIEKVIKDSNSKVKPDEVVSFIEPASILQTPIGKQKLVTEGYEELEKNVKYVIFLKKNSKQEYSMFYGNLSSYDLDGASPQKIDSSSPAEHNGKKTEFKKQVHELLNTAN